jgi:transposase-like protein
MDQALVQFRHAAARENRGRRGLQRRYSPALQQRAVEYWRQRRRAGDGVPTVAAALGIAPWSLHRWIQASKTRVRFHPVQLITPEPVRAVPSVVIRLTADGPRVEGLDVEAAAKLLVLLR